jgi:DNA repair protein RecO (recombination protein O)
MAGRSLKSEAIVLRSMRYGEADRILHLYTPGRGRVSAIAKGVRKAKSRFGGRLEPFFHIEGMFHEGRSEMLTVTGATTITAHARLREHGPSLDAAARACDAVSRLFATDDPHPGVFHLLANQLGLLDAGAGGDRYATAANGLAFRLKLLLAAGIAPQLSACASCGEAEHVSGFSGAQGGVVCPACEAGAFRLDEPSHAFLVGSLALPLAQAPAAAPAALRQADRAVRETAEHHAGVRLASLSDRVASAV